MYGMRWNGMERNRINWTPAGIFSRRNSRHIIAFTNIKVVFSETKQNMCELQIVTYFN